MSAWDLMLVLSAATFVTLAGRATLRDVDLYWHRVVGETIVSQGWPSWPGGFDPISYSDAHWLPAAWAPEVLYHFVVDAWGYEAITWLRLILVAAFAVALAVVLRHHRPPWVAFLVFTATALPLFLYMQDRPQAFSFVMLVALSWAFHRAVTSDWIPQWWLVGGFSWLWANLHGLWILVPLSACLIAICCAINKWGAHHCIAWIGRGAVSVGAAALTPFGPELILTPLRVSEAAVLSNEWRPVTIDSTNLRSVLILLGLILISLSMRRVAPPLGTLLAIASWLAVAPLNNRNAAVAAVMLAPFAADLLRDAFTHVHASATVPLWAASSAAVAASLVVVASYAGESAIPEGQPLEIARELSDRGTTRALVEYDAAGFIREFGGDDVRVAVDGRADRYGAETLHNFRDMTAAKPGWEATFAGYDPDVVVAVEDQAFVPLLEGQGWDVTMTDGAWVLLEPRSVAP